MSKVIVSGLLAAVMVAAIVVGVSGGGDSDTSDVVSRISPGIAVLNREVAALRDDVVELTDSVRSLHDAQNELSKDLRSAPVPVPVASGESGEVVPVVSSADLRGYVAAVLEEQDRVKEENRQREREEVRARMEERRRETDALKQGPYDRYNLKINSLGAVLSMTDAQKQGYFELTTAYRDKVEQQTKQLREQRERASEESGDDDGGSRDRRRRSGDREGEREKFREVYNGIQEEFTAEMQQLLSVDQFATYSELSRDARSFYDRDQVFASGEDRGGRFTGGWSGGSSGGRGGGRGRR